MAVIGNARSGIEVVTHRAHWWKVRRQGTPGRCILEQVKDRAKDVVQVNLPWIGTLAATFQQWTQLVKLFTTDIAWITLSAHFRPTSPQTRFGQKNIDHVLRNLRHS